MAKLIDSPSVSETEINPLSGSEARAILEAATERRNSVCWSVGLALGLVPHADGSAHPCRHWTRWSCHQTRTCLAPRSDPRRTTAAPVLPPADQYKQAARAHMYSEADGYWHGRVTMGVKDDGSPDRRHRKARTEAEVTKKVRELERKRDAAQVDKPGRAPTVEQWMTTYLETIAPRGLAPRSLDDYWSKTRNWIIPRLGRHRLDRLQPEHLDKMYAKMYEAGKADSHVLKVHRILSRALEVAHRRGKVARNVAKLVDAPSVSETEISPLDASEARAILEVAAGRRNGARWSVGLALGLRQGEALGLRWSYVDLEKSLVHVRWQLQRVPWRHGCADASVCGTDHKPAARARMCPQRRSGGLVLREPKGKSKRVVPLPPQLVAILQAHRASQVEERLTAGEMWEDNDLVFARPDGKPVDPRDDYDEWKELLTTAEIRHARVHDGRHTAATLLIEQGVHPRAVMEILGHSDLRLTQRYTHVASPMVQEASQRMGAVLWGS